MGDVRVSLHPGIAFLRAGAAAPRGAGPLRAQKRWGGTRRLATTRRCTPLAIGSRPGMLRPDHAATEASITAGTHGGPAAFRKALRAKDLTAPRAKVPRKHGSDSRGACKPLAGAVDSRAEVTKLPPLGPSRRPSGSPLLKCGPVESRRTRVFALLFPRRRLPYQRAVGVGCWPRYR